MAPSPSLPSPVGSARPLAAAVRAGRVVRAAAFWSAVALPVAAIAALAVGVDLATVGFLLVCNAAALVVGHGYRDDGRRNHDH
jgi:hypothetical protein